MALDHIELASLNVPDDPQTRARFAELTRPGGVELRPAETYEARDPGTLITVTVNRAKMVTGFIGALVTAAIESATVIGIPFAVTDLAGAIGTLVTQALDNLVGIAKRFAEALSKVRDITSMMSDGELPKNQWPQAVTG